MSLLTLSMCVLLNEPLCRSGRLLGVAAQQSLRFDWRRYAALGPHYNMHMYQVRLWALEHALTMIGRTLTGARVLEVGCGTGFYTKYCAQQGVVDYVGLDLTSVSVSELQKRFSKFHFVRADVTQGTPDVGMNFDVVLVADVLFHIVDDHAFAAVIRNIAFWLRNGGLLIASDVFPPSTVQTAPHCRNRSLDNYQIHFRQYGLQIIHMKPIFAVLQPPPVILGVARPWRWYARLWRYSLRLARWTPIDRLLPDLLAWLDRRFFLPRWGIQAPNSKWLPAVKDDVA